MGLGEDPQVRVGIEGRIGHPHFGHADGDTGEAVPAHVEEVLAHGGAMIPPPGGSPNPSAASRGGEVPPGMRPS